MATMTLIITAGQNVGTSQRDATADISPKLTATLAPTAMTGTIMMLDERTTMIRTSRAMGKAIVSIDLRSTTAAPDMSMIIVSIPMAYTVNVPFRVSICSSSVLRKYLTNLAAGPLPVSAIDISMMVERFCGPKNALSTNCMAIGSSWISSSFHVYRPTSCVTKSFPPG